MKQRACDQPVADRALLNVEGRSPRLGYEVSVGCASPQQPVRSTATVTQPVACRVGSTVQAGLPARTAKLARRASSMDGASYARSSRKMLLHFRYSRHPWRSDRRAGALDEAWMQNLVPASACDQPVADRALSNAEGRSPNPQQPVRSTAANSGAGRSTSCHSISRLLPTSRRSRKMLLHFRRFRRPWRSDRAIIP